MVNETKKQKGCVTMNKIDELLTALQKREEEKEKPKNMVLWVLAVIGAVTAIAAIAYAVYRYFTPEYLEDFEEDFDFYMDEETDIE